MKCIMTGLLACGLMMSWTALAPAADSPGGKDCRAEGLSYEQATGVGSPQSAAARSSEPSTTSW